MTLHVDLHIHSCLSPCADDDMTPYNIAAVASLRGLDAISVTDHNACANSGICAQACSDFGLLFLPGVEVTTQEEIHALCYFPSLEALQDFCALLEQKQSFVPNRSDFFGRQIIVDADDAPAGECPRWLLQAVALPLETVEREAMARNGILVPAHIDRGENSLLANLGFIPPALHARVMEVTEKTELDPRYRPIRSSDAHRLQDILEFGFPLQTAASSISDILNELMRQS